MNAPLHPDYKELWEGALKAYATKNRSGCVCTLDPDTDEVIKVCGAHDEWLEKQIALKGAPAAPVAAEPTLYQYRMRAGWLSPPQWAEWSNCTALSASDYERMPEMHDYHYEVRRLYLIGPQAAPVAAESKKHTPRVTEGMLKQQEELSTEAINIGERLAAIRAALAAALPVEPTDEQIIALRKATPYAVDKPWAGTVSFARGVLAMKTVQQASAAPKGEGT
jgi:hypothetical protein